jgi:excisionase family DNA binding protein
MHREDKAAPAADDNRKRRVRDAVGETKKWLMTPAQVAERCGVTVNTVYWWRHLKIIDYIKINRLIRFDPDAVEAFLAARKVAAVE